MITAEFNVIPIGTSHTSLSEYVAAAVSALDELDVKYQLSGMGTQIETENLDDLFNAIKTAHEAVIKIGANRVATNIKIDDRRDADRGLEDKIISVKKIL